MQSVQIVNEFYIHRSVHRGSNLIIVQQDATVFSLLYFCRQLYMFRVLTSISRSSYNCNYCFWHWLTGSATNQLNDESGRQQIQMTSARSCNYSWMNSWWMVTPKTCRAAYRNVINWIQWHLVGQLFNSKWIHIALIATRKTTILKIILYLQNIYCSHFAEGMFESPLQ